MNLFDMTRDEWILFGIVIVTLAIPSLIKPTSEWLGKKLHLVKQEKFEGASKEKTSEITINSDSSSEKNSDEIAG